MRHIRWAIVALFLPWNAGAQEGVGAMTAYIGAWGPDPQGELVQADADRADDVAFWFMWGDPDQRTIRFFEGVPDGDLERHVFQGLVAADPRTGRIEFFGLQRRDNFLYRGHFEVTESGFERYYTVTYPEDHPLGAEPGEIHYRDRCSRHSAVTLACFTDQKLGEHWQAWGDGKPYVLVRLDK